MDFTVFRSAFNKEEMFHGFAAVSYQFVRWKWRFTSQFKKSVMDLFILMPLMANAEKTAAINCIENMIFYNCKGAYSLIASW